MAYRNIIYTKVNKNEIILDQDGTKCLHSHSTIILTINLQYINLHVL